MMYRKTDFCLLRAEKCCHARLSIGDAKLIRKALALRLVLIVLRSNAILSAAKN
jgi:hypothetical protein